jgi:uncharacterized membrane protein
LFDTLIKLIILLSWFKAKCQKKKKIVVGKVIVAKAIGIFILYIGKTRFVINRPGGKKNNSKKENQ